MGASGPAGATGPSGAQGASGPQGGDGYTTLVLPIALDVDDDDCPTGGVHIYIGLDNGDNGETANNGTLEEGEVDSDEVICNGDQGPAGQDGQDGQNGTGPSGPQGEQGVAGPAGVTGPAGATGPAGSGDTGAMGEKGDTGEKGDMGEQGERGEAGAIGHSSLVRMSELDEGECKDSGVVVQSGVDDNDSGELDDDEVDTTAVVCVPGSQVMVSHDSGGCSVATPGTSKPVSGLAWLLSGLPLLVLMRRRRRARR
jgi:MYXO-CTERM domain-containing protein